MAFPDLVLRPGGELWTEATGVPVNGPQTFATGLVGLDLSMLDPDWIFFNVVALGPSITGCTFVSLSADRQHVTLDFTQTGADAATVMLQVVSSLIR